MNILVTGNLGYVGGMLVPYLREKHFRSRIVCYDTGYFAHCITTRARAPESFADLQYFGDIRAIPDQVIRGTDAIVHLSAISNDPIGNEYENDMTITALRFATACGMSHGGSLSDAERRARRRISSAGFDQTFNLILVGMND
jgi:nucleoside-diphosphate-sugar epimerase